MAKKNARDLDDVWAELAEGNDIMMNTSESEGMTYQKYMKLYTGIYDYCTKTTVTGQDGIGGGQRPGGAQLQGGQLYTRLVSYLKDHLSKTSQKVIGQPGLQDEKLLEAYSREWARYTRGALYLDRLFIYLNRHWVKREKDEGKKRVYTIHTLALVIWKECIFGISDTDADRRPGDSISSQARMGEELQQKIQAGLLKIIEKQRNGETIDVTVVKNVVTSLVELGHDENDSSSSSSTRQSLSFYKRIFFDPFLERTGVYYKDESERFIQENSVTEYMKKIETRLKEEEDRVMMYLHASSSKDLISKCETCLIKDHIEVMQEEFKKLLINEQEDDLQRMFSLLNRISNGLDPLRSVFEAHVKATGLAAVEKIAGKDAKEVDPKTYVQAMLEVHAKNASLVVKAFKSDPGFNGSLDKACKTYVNYNSVCGTSSAKSPELLASHADALLKKTNKATGEDELEDALKNIMVIFKYLEDKDVFQKYYSKLLAKRLVYFASASDDAEESMLNKLKDAAGFEYVSKLRRMFTDVTVCKDLNSQFSESAVQKDHGTFDFHILVLGTSSWPLQAPGTEFELPPELLSTQTRFLHFYDSKHSGRKLSWLWHLNRVDLRTTYTPQKYTLTTSIYQAGVLLQFNSEGDSVTYEHLKAATKLEDDTLKPILDQLLRAKVITKEGSDSYELNLAYRSKKVRVNISAPLPKQKQADDADVLKSVDEDRKLLIQAIIVRIMKSRKTMKNQALIQETINQLSSRFMPKIGDIKKAIEHLLDKEYLEREEGSRDTFRYLA